MVEIGHGAILLHPFICRTMLQEASGRFSYQLLLERLIFFCQVAIVVVILIVFLVDEILGNVAMLCCLGE